MTISHANPNQLRPSDDGSGSIIKIGPERQFEAVAKLLANGPTADREHVRRFIEFSKTHRINLNEMWSKLDAQGRIESTFLAVPNPGRTAMTFATRPNGRAHARSLSGLIEYAANQLVHCDVNLAQTLLDPGEETDRDVYLAAGFNELAILSYLERPLRLRKGERAATIQWPPGVVPVQYNDAQRGELVDVLDRSYEDTLDCPGLRGHRRTEDIFEGHRASGRFDPALWTIVRNDRDAIGALLLNPSADHHGVELVYLGLIKSARGQGLGTQLLRFGLQLLQERSERIVTLAVDESNAPAMNLYLREGFKPALRRRALIKPVR